MTAVDWVLFVSGILVGGADEFLSNWSHELPCVADLASIIQSMYFIYLYMHEFIKTNDA